MPLRYAFAQAVPGDARGANDTAYAPKRLPDSVKGMPCPVGHPVRYRSPPVCKSAARLPPFVARLFLRQPDAFALRIRETPPEAGDFGETARRFRSCVPLARESVPYVCPANFAMRILPCSGRKLSVRSPVSGAVRPVSCPDPTGAVQVTRPDERHDA